MKKFLGNRAFYKEAVIIATPMIIQQFITNSVNLIDNLMVGSLGDEALAAVSVSNQFFFMFNLAVMGALVGAGIYTSQFYGAKDYKHLKMTFSFKVMICAIFSVIGFLIFLFFRKTLIGLFVADKVTFELTYSYLSIAMFNVFSVILIFALSFSFREIAKPKIPLISSFVAVFTNTFLNYALIYGNFGAPTLGVRGAAIATVIARIVEVSILIIYLKSDHGIFYDKFSDLFAFSKKLYKDIVIKMLPLTVNEILWSTGMTVFYYAYSTRGSDTLAGFAISQTINNLAFVLFGGMSGAITVMVGNRLGANKIEEAKINSRQLIVFTLMISLVVSTILFILAPTIVGLYNVSDEVRFIAIRAIRTNAIFFPLFVYTVGIFFSLRAGGDTRSTMLMDSVYMWIFTVPFVLLISMFTDFPSTTLLLIVVSTDIPKALIATYFYRKGNWLKNLAIEEKSA